MWIELIVIIFGLFIWLAQIEYKRFFSIGESVLFIIKQAKNCYTPLGSCVTKEDLKFRMKLFENHCECYLEEFERSLIRLELLKNTDSIKEIFHKYYNWMREFKTNILVCSIGKDSIKIEEKQQDHFWDIDGKSDKLLEDLCHKLKEELMPHLNNPYTSYIKRHFPSVTSFFSHKD